MRRNCCIIGVCWERSEVKPWSPCCSVTGRLVILRHDVVVVRDAIIWLLCRLRDSGVSIRWRLRLLQRPIGLEIPSFMQNCREYSLTVFSVKGPAWPLRGGLTLALLVAGGCVHILSLLVWDRVEWVGRPFP